MTEQWRVTISGNDLIPIFDAAATVSEHPQIRLLSLGFAFVLAAEHAGISREQLTSLIEQTYGCAVAEVHLTDTPLH